MSEKGLNDEIAGLLKRVFSKYINVDKAVLFGSRAKGTAQDSSDIDIAVFGINDDLEIEKIAMDLDELPLPYKFDVKAYNGIRNVALCQHIDRVGITIYKKT